jgi:hypothetical protein
MVDRADARPVPHRLLPGPVPSPSPCSSMPQRAAPLRYTPL